MAVIAGDGDGMVAVVFARVGGFRVGVLAFPRLLRGAALGHPSEDGIVGAGLEGGAEGGEDVGAVQLGLRLDRYAGRADGVRGRKAVGEGAAKLAGRFTEGGGVGDGRSTVCKRDQAASIFTCNNSSIEAVLNRNFAAPRGHTGKAADVCVAFTFDR